MGKGRESSALKDYENQPRPDSHYKRLLLRFVFLTTACSLIPLLLVGWGINGHYTRFAKSRLIHSLETQLADHRKIIELFLQERTSRLHLIAWTHSLAYLETGNNLESMFTVMNRMDGSFADLGVIDAEGSHRAYAGPYDLMGKNYLGAQWFNEVLEKGVYISDVFMGFRQVPHFVIAVLRIEEGARWILRATVNSELFNALVQGMQVGKSGEIVLLNQEGVFQATPKFSGAIMGRAPFSPGGLHDGVKIETVAADEKNAPSRAHHQIVAQTWLDEPRWLLMIRQDYEEALDEVNHANRLTLFFLYISAAIILVVTFFITRYMVSVVKKRDIEAEGLNNQIMEASKLAAIGELSAGVAHEINNPLAIILTEKQIVADMIGETRRLEKGFKERLENALAQITTQVKRCKRITQNLLRFSRRTTSVIETMDLNAFIEEVIELMEREARTSGIRLLFDPGESMPPLVTDPSQLQQVFLNLITNAMDAHDGKPYGTISISTRHDPLRDGVVVKFADTGTGIPADKITRIFDPFFTTKPVGKGTGLGLSISYGIIKRLGGEISVESEVGQGTEFTISLPLSAPLQANGEDANGRRSLSPE